MKVRPYLTKVYFYFGKPELTVMGLCNFCTIDFLVHGIAKNKLLSLTKIKTLSF